MAAKALRGSLAGAHGNAPEPWGPARLDRSGYRGARRAKHEETAPIAQISHFLANQAHRGNIPGP